MSDKTSGLKIGITVIVASYNEEENIEPVLRELHAELSRHEDIDFDILAYNDKSTDRTGEIIERLSQELSSVIPVHNEHNLGIGGILQDGIKRASKNKIIILPGDGQFDNNDIPRLIRESVGTDILLTFHINYKDRTLVRRALSYLFHIIVRCLFQVPYHYFNWTHVFNKDIFQEIDIISDRFTCGAEIDIKAHKLGYRIKETGAILSERTAGKSTALKISSIFNAGYNIAKLWYVIHVREREKYRSQKGIKVHY